MISLITSDIELLEVYYAHTVSPIAIAALTTIVMVSFIASQATKFNAGRASLGKFVLAVVAMLSSFGPVSALSALSTSLSDRQKQRIGIARAFLHGGQFMLLDEITANLDALNEGIILKSLKEAAKDKTIIIVSHRKSTLAIADRILELKPLAAS